MLDLETVNNQYLVIGTVDRTDWKRIDQNKLSIQATIEALYDFMCQKSTTIGR